MLPDQKSSKPHTPGPWIARKSSGLNAYTITNASGAYLADVWGVDEPVPNGVASGEVKANARLIACAPELLEACQKTIEENGELADGDNCTLIDLKRAIAKAEGR